MLRKDVANKGTKKGERKLGRMDTKKMIEEMKLNKRSEGRDNKPKTQGEEWKRQEINEKREGIRQHSPSQHIIHIQRFSCTQPINVIRHSPEHVRGRSQGLGQGPRFPPGSILSFIPHSTFRLKQTEDKNKKLIIINGDNLV